MLGNQILILLMMLIFCFCLGLSCMLVLIPNLSDQAEMMLVVSLLTKEGLIKGKKKKARYYYKSSQRLKQREPGSLEFIFCIVVKLSEQFNTEKKEEQLYFWKNPFTFILLVVRNISYLNDVFWNLNTFAKTSQVLGFWSKFYDRKE